MVHAHKSCWGSGRLAGLRKDGSWGKLLGAGPGCQVQGKLNSSPGHSFLFGMERRLCAIKGVQLLLSPAGSGSSSPAAQSRKVPCSPHRCVGLADDPSSSLSYSEPCLLIGLGNGHYPRYLMEL